MKKEQNIQWNKNKGFTAALLFCVVGVVVTTFAAIDGLFEPKKPQTQPVEPRQEELKWDVENIWTEPAETKKSDVPVPSSGLSQQPKSSQSSALPEKASAKQPAAAVPPASAAPSYLSAVRGKVIKPFSGDELVYDETMQDWRTHNGTDYQATLKEDVRSICAGTVTEVKQDAQWGTVITVKAENEITVRYCGLAEKTYAKQNDTVKIGTVLGKVGECPAEIAAEPHLHLEVIQNGKEIDPETLFAK